MNKFKKLSTVILAVCITVTILSSCNKNENPNSTTTFIDENIVTEIITEFITKKDVITVNVTDAVGEVSVSVSEKIVSVPVTQIVTKLKNSETDKTTKKSDVIHTPSTSVTYTPLITSAKTDVDNNKTTKAKETKTTNTYINTTVATTKKPVINDIINEKSVGISMLTKTDPVQIGNQATIFIQGKPGKTYSIDFYESPSSVANTSSLEDKKADTNGFVSWTFEIGSNCNPGKRKLVIKEKNSSNYIETSITVK